MKFSELSHFKQRTVVSLIIASLFVCTLVFSYSPVLAPLFVFLIFALQSLSLREYYELSKAKGHHPLAKLGIGASLAYVVATYLSLRFTHAALLPETVLLASLALFFLFFFRRGTLPLTNLAITVFGLAYLTIPLTYVLNINYFPFTSDIQDGRWWVVYLFGVTKLTDMGAYFFGKMFGKIPLAPEISPKKTVEGAFGGVFVAILSSLAFYGLVHLFTLPPIQITLWQSIWLAIILSVVGQFGDLAESLLKRDAEVKDSSHLPGLGGFLDIVDSIIFAAPLLYLFLKMQ
jgi:phosphatidate cytidylyltransferase